MNKKTRAAILLLLVAGIALSIASCKKDKTSALNTDYQYNYYPLDSGHYVIYNVDSIFYSYNGIYTRDTVHYQWKMLVADTFYDNQNVLNYRLEYYRRNDSVSQWNIDRVWYAKRTTTNLQVQEDDIRFIKLVFPPQVNEDWNGNIYVPTTASYSVFQNWDYHYTAIDSAATVGNSNYNVLVVSEVNQENLIQKTLRREMYSKNVGLVYQEWEALSKQQVNTDWNTGPENGFRIRMSIYDHN